MYRESCKVKDGHFIQEQIITLSCVPNAIQPGTLKPSLGWIVFPIILSEQLFPSALSFRMIANLLSHGLYYSSFSMLASKKIFIDIGIAMQCVACVAMDRSYLQEIGQLLRWSQCRSQQRHILWNQPFLTADAMHNHRKAILHGQQIAVWGAGLLPSHNTPWVSNEIMRLWEGEIEADRTGTVLIVLIDVLGPDNRNDLVHDEVKLCG